jgi:hypothetical protein
MAEKTGSKSDLGKVTLVAAFTAAATTFVTGFPMDFLREFIMFPLFHSSDWTPMLTEVMNEYILPHINASASFFGVGPPVIPAVGVPTFSF